MSIRKSHPFLLLILCILSILGIAFIFVFFVPRSAADPDISVDDSMEPYSYIITPSQDIQNLEVTFEFYDSNWKLLDTIPKEIGNVSKGEKYTVTFSISDFAFNIIVLRHSKWKVTAGSVPLYKT